MAMTPVQVLQMVINGMPNCSTLARVRALMGSDTSELRTPAPVQPASSSSTNSMPSFSQTFTELAYSSGQEPLATHPG